MTIHKTNKPRVAEDGEYATATSTLPVLQYYPARGRAEPIRCVSACVHGQLEVEGSG